MEIWKDIDNFPGYQISNRGRVRTFWKRKHYPTGYGSYNFIGNEPKIVPVSDDGNGYMKAMLYCGNDGRRYCKKIHRLVAEAFIPIPDGDCEYTVDHICSGPEGKLDNSVSNLRWISRRENIKKAYRDGVCDERIRLQNKPVSCTDLWSGEEIYFGSIKEVSLALGVTQSTVSHAIADGRSVSRRYIVEFLEGEDRLLYGQYDY